MSIVVGYIPTEEGRIALDAATEEAALRSTGLRILVPSTEDDNARTKGEIARAVKRASRLGVAVRVQELEGDDEPGDVLIDVSYEDDVQLIVIGVRRRSRVGKLIMGSTAQRVILEAGCAVQAVKPPVGPRG